MALCSQVFNNAAKRSCAFGVPELQVKRSCFGRDIGKAAAVYSSSDDDISSNDEQSCYNADQVRAKRRASTRISFSLNSELSRAISKYSDDDESCSDGENDDNIDCKLSSSPGINKKLMHISDSSTASNGKKIIPDADKDSRSRCFEYLVGAIDEAWARYCNATSSVEDEVYGYDTPLSIVTDDEDYFGNTTDLTEYEDSEFEYSGKDSSSISARSHNRTDSASNRMNMVNSTAIGTSESDKPSILSASTSKDPSSSQLQALKDRLTKAKYYLQDLVDSEDFNDASAFWKRWDMIKYTTIELVEDDDDDELVESTIDELEDGRLFVN